MPSSNEEGNGPHIKKTIIFEGLSSLILHNNEPFLYWIVMCDEKRIVYNDQLSDWTKKLQSTSQSQSCTKKRSWSLFSGLLPIWSTTTFWCQRNHDICSANWWEVRKTAMPAASTGHRKGPVLPHNARLQVSQPTLQSWMNRARNFCLIHHIHLISHQRTTTSLSISTTFCREDAKHVSITEPLCYMPETNKYCKSALLQFFKKRAHKHTKRARETGSPVTISPSKMHQNPSWSLEMPHSRNMSFMSWWGFITLKCQTSVSNL